MKRIIKSIMSLVVISLLGNVVAFGQSDTPCGAPVLTVNTSCVNTIATINGSANQQTNGANGGSPSCGFMGEDVWFSFVAPASGGVGVTFTSGTITDAVAGLYNGPCTAPTEIVCDDDGGAGLMPALSGTGLTPGATYYIRMYEYGGGTGNFDLCVTELAAPPTNINCSVPDPLCSGSTLTFTAQSNGTDADVVNPGNDYDCLFTSPNPSWYYLEISTAGFLAIDITAGSDIDFELWGPFPNLANAVANCDSYGVPVDCSYSASATEQASASGVLPGEVYVLLITNYANTVQTITVTDALSNTASTNCAIVTLPVELAKFDAKRMDNEVELSWMTASEIDNDYFIVERSVDAKVWTAIDIVDGVGTTTSENYYESIDRNPVDEITYYRLKQFDFNGSSTLSDVISVGYAGENSLKLYPNPANENVTVFSSNKFSNLTLTDISGTVILNNDYSGINQTQLDLTNVKRGVYYVSVVSKVGVEVIKLIVH